MYTLLLQFLNTLLFTYILHDTQRHAISTYNFLLDEGRRVAAGLFAMHDYVSTGPVHSKSRSPLSPDELDRRGTIRKT